MTNLILEQSVELKQMEIEMEKMIKEKEQAAKIVVFPLEELPIIAIPIATSSTTIIGATAYQLENAVHNLSL